MRSLVAVVLFAVVSVCGTAVLDEPVAAQDSDPVPTTLPRGGGGVGSIIGPAPGEGVAPTDADDRGGAAQLALFGVLVVAISGIALLVRRDMGRARTRTAATQE